MIFDQKELAQALKFLEDNYYDPTINNNRNYGADSTAPLSVTEKYRFESMKQSVFRNINYEKSYFENVALTGSFFDNVTFRDTDLIGSSFANCDFYRVVIDGNNKTLEANNFTHSNFENCELKNACLFKSGMLNALFHICNFENMTIRGSTIEGTKFISCNLVNCDFGQVNLDYTFFNKNTYSNVVFPFYQLAYIIGFADFINDPSQTIFARVKRGNVTATEYRQAFDKLILFYLDKDEYFPACTLCIAKKDFDGAKSYLLDGITKAIATRNFRLISHFCQLGRLHGLLDEKIKYKINKAMDAFIRSKAVPETQLNYYLIYIGQIRNILNEGSADTITLNYTINTTTCKENEEGVSFVNDLVNDLNINLSATKNIEGFQISLSNHSPFEIAIQVIGFAGSIASIASLVWQTISAVKGRKECYRMVKVDKDIFNKYIDARVDALREELLKLNTQYTGTALNRYIKSVTQSLKTDLEELYSKDVMIFKLENEPKS